MGISELKHVVRPLPNGGQVVVLDTGAVITAEDCAMLQAMYSRSPASLFVHLEKLANVGSGKFMEQFYVGYGHKSIGDCGDVVIFIEGVSMLVAKAVQDWMLYRGQECSTRYLDFSRQLFLNPSGLAQADCILEVWRRFYTDNLPLVREHVAQQFPINPSEDEKIYIKAISARAFDIMRSFLPAGAETSLSWTVDLRQAADKLRELRNHPLEEVKLVAEAIESALSEVYPNSFNHKCYEATEDYYHDWMKGDYFLVLAPYDEWPCEVTLVRQGIDKSQLRDYESFLVNRPPKTELPKKFARAGVAQFHWLLDFGSYRDLQRHRAVIQLMPVLTADYGFEPWYLEQLPEGLRTKVTETILPSFERELEVMADRIGILDCQYLIPMGYRVPCEVTGDLPALVYLVELRSGSAVHPTMRRRAQQLAQILETEFGPVGLKLHIDWSDIGRFDIKRGQQDIIQKQ